ncbi:MAG TPA: hypothetical protein VNG33_03470 [Polyangiaceae bacterium]|nr:hypothetical protein [Polyangiaceae bacterium]
MKRSQRQQAVCAVAFAVTGVVAPLHAQSSAARPPQNLPEPEATHFEFRAPPGCGSAEDFAAHVRRRSSRIRLISGANAPRSLLVEISEPGAGGTLRGTVTVVEPDGATRKRELKAAACAEAVDALSLIATVTLDPDAMLDEPTPAAEPEPKLAPPVATKPTARAAEPAPAAPSPPAYRMSVGVAAALLVQMAPEPAFGGSASVALELNPGRLLAPFLRLSLVHAERRGLSEQAGNANFAFTLPTLDVCPVRLGSRAVGVRACAFSTLGVLEVWGSGVTNKESHSRLYGAAGAAMSFGLRISKGFEIIADGRAGLPFWRDRFAFDEVAFYRTPMLGFSAGAGVAGGFP